jgi:hypothetical protein
MKLKELLRVIEKGTKISIRSGAYEHHLNSEERSTPQSILAESEVTSIRNGVDSIVIWTK